MAKAHAPDKPTNHGNFTTYLMGFALSVSLTLAAYFAVVNNVLSGDTVVVAIIVLALAQLMVQLFFFLHMGNEAKPRWNLMAFGFMALVVLIIGIGSLWIMHNLDYNMMPDEMDDYMMEQVDKGF